MNNKIANIIVSYLDDLDWIDKIAGLTQIARVTKGGVEKRFPISCDMAFDDACTKGCYDELMPNSQYSSIIFFEDGSFNFSRAEGNKLYYESRLRMVVWLNYKKLTGGCGSTSEYIISIIKALPVLPQNIGDMLRLSMTVMSQASRTSGIFGKYTFDEKNSQYLMIPFDYFALDIRTTFHIINECIEPDPGGCTEC
jgi:hypothetical protein